MPGEMARSPDRTSFATAGTPEALRRPPVASRAPRRLLSSTPFQSSSGECRLKITLPVICRSPRESATQRLGINTFSNAPN